MKKTAIAIAVALSGFANVAQAVPKDDTWYTGAKLGWSQYHDKGYYGNGYRDNDGPSHESQLGAGAFGGYQANQHLGLEFGYDWLGRMPNKGNNINGAFKAQGVQLAAKLSYPMMEDLDVYTRLGGMVWRADATQNNGTRISDHDTGISPLAAVGVEYAMTKNWATRLDYQWVNNTGDAGTVGARPDNSMLNIGISYRFGQEEEAAPVVKQAPDPIFETKHFTLKSDVLFNFNKTTLKPEGQQTLDQLYTRLSNLDPKDGSVIVLGYTDRIGSEQYNRKLSKKRAQSVVEYLVSKGIPDNKISARGEGESDSITGNTCDNVRGRNAQIKCLAPDRRVEIEVKGTKEIMTQPQT